MEWLFGIVIASMFALLVYSIISTSIVFSKKAQPGLDSFFEGIYRLLHPRSHSERPLSKGSKPN
jgi:hypothetical protein